jgi:hypothetical protein
MLAKQVLTNEQQGQSHQPTKMERFEGWLEKNHAQQPSLGAEAKAWVREGREDFLNVLLKAFPDSMPLSREMGAPGSPTPQQTTADLMGKPISLDR